MKPLISLAFGLCLLPCTALAADLSSVQGKWLMDYRAQNDRPAQASIAIGGSEHSIVFHSWRDASGNSRRIPCLDRQFPLEITDAPEGRVAMRVASEKVMRDCPIPVIEFTVQGGQLTNGFMNRQQPVQRDPVQFKRH